MTKHLPSTKCTSPPHNPQPFYEEEGTDIPVTRFVPSFRKLIAGDGLTGGGDLSKDRKFDVVFGEEEKTVTEGNDPRLSDARDWSAPQITSQEITEGTEEEPRKVSPKDLRDAANAWWDNREGTQPIESIDGLQEILDSIGSSPAATGNLFSIVKVVEMFGGDEYVITAEDVGKTLVFESVTDKLNILMSACFGQVNDEIYVVAPTAFYHDTENPVNFYTEIHYPGQPGDSIKVPPIVARGLVPSFRDGRAIACLKKIFSNQTGMGNWLLFGDLASEADE